MLKQDPPTPPRYEPPAAPGTDTKLAPNIELPAKSGEPSAWKRFGKLAAEQAIPIAVGLVSLVIAVDAWLEARPMAWEKERALASIEVSDSVVKSDPKSRNSEALVTVKVSNVGELTFAILDLHLDVETTGSLTGIWKENSLLARRASALPIGLRPFAMRDADSSHATFQFDTTQKSWHVVDPGRSVQIMFAQPLRGAGHLALGVNLYTQPIKMADVANAIKVDEIVNGIKRPTMPESGTGEVSELPVYPYSAGHVIIVPPT